MMTIMKKIRPENLKFLAKIANLHRETREHFQLSRDNKSFKMTKDEQHMTNHSEI